MNLRAFAILLVVGVTTLLLQPSASVAAPDADEPYEDAPDIALPPAEGTAPPAEEVEAITDVISRQIRCPVCQGSAISDSPAEPAVAMRDRVRELVREGYTEGQILDYYATRYGEWILLSPKAEGLNWILWTVPPILTGFGLSWLLVVVIRWSKEPDEVPLPSDVGDMPIDKYEAMLLEELEK